MFGCMIGTEQFVGCELERRPETDRAPASSYCFSFWLLSWKKQEQGTFSVVRSLRQKTEIQILSRKQLLIAACLSGRYLSYQCALTLVPAYLARLRVGRKPAAEQEEENAVSRVLLSCTYVYKNINDWNRFAMESLTLNLDKKPLEGTLYETTFFISILFRFPFFHSPEHQDSIYDVFREVLENTSGKRRRRRGKK